MSGAVIESNFQQHLRVLSLKESWKNISFEMTRLMNNKNNNHYWINPSVNLETLLIMQLPFCSDANFIFSSNVASCKLTTLSLHFTMFSVNSKNKLEKQLFTN